MRFSIVIPSYGQAEYLEEAIQSVLCQTFSPADYEVIIVDDCSTDGSLEIAKRYEPRIKVIRQINKGLASARNTGIMNAIGEYVLFLDADDKLAPNALQEVFEAAYKRNSVSFSFYQEADVVGLSLQSFGDTSQFVPLMEGPTFDDFKEGNRMAYCAAIKRSILLKVGGYSPRYDALGGWEDLALWYDLMSRRYKLRTIGQGNPLLMYRTKGQSMWKEAEKNKVALWAQIIKDFPEAKDHAKA